MAASKQDPTNLAPSNSTPISSNAPAGQSIALPAASATSSPPNTSNTQSSAPGALTEAVKATPIPPKSNTTKADNPPAMATNNPYSSLQPGTVFTEETTADEKIETLNRQLAELKADYDERVPRLWTHVGELQGNEAKRNTDVNVMNAFNAAPVKLMTKIDDRTKKFEEEARKRLLALKTRVKNQDAQIQSLQQQNTNFLTAFTEMQGLYHKHDQEIADVKYTIDYIGLKLGLGNYDSISQLNVSNPPDAWGTAKMASALPVVPQQQQQRHQAQTNYSSNFPPMQNQQTASNPSTVSQLAQRPAVSHAQSISQLTTPPVKSTPPSSARRGGSRGGRSGYPVL